MLIIVQLEISQCLLADCSSLLLTPESSTLKRLTHIGFRL